MVFSSKSLQKIKIQVIDNQEAGSTIISTYQSQRSTIAVPVAVGWYQQIEERNAGLYVFIYSQFLTSSYINIIYS
jgi:hypothetical protein